MTSTTTSKRVLFTTEMVLPNGIATHIKTLIEKLHQRGWSTALATRHFADSAPVNEGWLREQGTQHFRVRFPKGFSWSTPLQVMKALSDLKTALRDYRPDVIHVHGFGVCPLLYPVRQLHNVPLVSTCHIAPPSSKKRWARTVGPASRLVGKTFGERVIAISSELHETIEDLWGIPRERVRLIHHGVNGEHFRPPTEENRAAARATFDLKEHEQAVCLIGRLNPMKGHDVLLKALARLQRAEVPAVALCAGDGTTDEIRTLRALAERLDVADRVRLLGFTDTRQVLWASDVSVLPSRREGFGLVVPESMLCGVVPIRTPAEGAADQIKDGEDGFLVLFDDDEALARRLRQLREHPQQRARMAARAEETARRRFTAERMIRDTTAVYDEVMA